VPKRSLRFTAPDAVVEQGLAEIRSQWDIPEGFPPDVVEEARAIEPALPDSDRTGIPFVTIDPPGARDLDQALHIERRGEGYTVRYAIADVGAFVPPNGAIDDEARNRGVTMYGPDRRTLLYPSVISEGHASLLPDEPRPALVWTLSLDAAGELGEIDVGRALVRSRDQLDYSTAQRQLDSDSAAESLQLLAEVGRLRQLIEEARGAVSLPIPDQEVVRHDDGWELVYRKPLPVEGWNAQISLLTGIAAARLMMSAKTGLLRTLPPARPEELKWLRRVAKALQVGWPESVDYADLIRSLDARIPAHAALLAESTTLFTGSGYQVLGPGVDPFEHSALATHYSHTTAPLRRLVDRFVGETCLAISDGHPVPDWVTGTLPSLPEIMARADSIAGSYEAACLDLVEAAVLSARLGETFEGVVVEVDSEGGHGDIQLRDPAVHARIEDGDLTLGEEIEVSLIEASVAERRVVFERA
jgi:exoribonuclease R